jgi:hypothetical protein
MAKLGRLHAAITAVAAIARRAYGGQKSDDKATAEEANIERRRTFLFNGRRYYVRTTVFGNEPPMIDPGGVHAHMRRNRQ